MSYLKIFENEHYIIVDKYACILSVPGRNEKEDDRPVLGRILENDLKIKIYPIHRLDYEVSGLIMFAKNPEAQKIANFWFEKKEIQKTYKAITMQSDERTEEFFGLGEIKEWRCKLLRGKKRAYESPHGKESLTHAKLILIDSQKKFYWELNPITGRSHQLRYELFRHGHPILGDKLYGSKDETEGNLGIALRAFRLDFSKASHKNSFALPDLLEID